MKQTRALAVCIVVLLLGFGLASCATGKCQKATMKLSIRGQVMTVQIKQGNSAPEEFDSVSHQIVVVPGTQKTRHKNECSIFFADIQGSSYSATSYYVSQELYADLSRYFGSRSLITADP